MRHFRIRTQGARVGPHYAKFEADSSIRSKVIRGPKFSKLGHVTQATPT